VDVSSRDQHAAVLGAACQLQIYQVIATRSVTDISIAWSLLYSSGLTLTTVYLMFKVSVTLIDAWEDLNPTWMDGSGTY
jgi:hypothetical protein